MYLYNFCTKNIEGYYVTDLQFSFHRGSHFLLKAKMIYCKILIDSFFTHWCTAIERILVISAKFKLKLVSNLRSWEGNFWAIIFCSRNPRRKMIVTVWTNLIFIYNFSQNLAMSFRKYEICFSFKCLLQYEFPKKNIPH